MSPSSWGLPVVTVKPRPWRVGSRVLGGDRPLLMGILNVTPDSFHDGGKYSGPEGVDAALRRCEEMVREGADIIDVGGESTRPGALAVAEDEERARVVPVIEAITKRFDLPVSIDTMKSGVARAALDAGAVIVNDVSAMTADPFMLEVPGPYGAGVVLNHMQGKPRGMQDAPNYCDVVGEVRDHLMARVRILAAAGVPKDRIAVDPGIGFGKRLADNYALIEKLEDLDAIGCPILLGHSRKSFLGKTAGLEGSDRLQPGVAVAVYAALKGASILRVHDVGATREALRIIEAVRTGA
ncbi:MAG TPA: dihydropteroate synthase [Fibrobacteria bacterium]|nr:dihydropteroate synthase [Fibrobacteria bacterium]